jgi:hypothetical protein
MKVKAIRYAGKADVYNLEVADTHDYAIENGVIVHNCRYVVVLTKPKVKTPVQISKKRRYNPLDSGERLYDNDDNGKVLPIKIPDVVIGG